MLQFWKLEINIEGMRPDVISIFFQFINKVQNNFFQFFFVLMIDEVI